jgi:hypothetical protein
MTEQSKIRNFSIIALVGTSCTPSLPPAGKAQPFRCASSPHRTRFAGLRRGPHLVRRVSL